MDAIKSFFRDHHAVPATDRGPQWHKATTAALEGHLMRMLEACNADEDRSKGAFEGCRDSMRVIAKELIFRTDRAADGFDEATLRKIAETCRRK